MLVEFKIQNFKSVKEEMVFSMQAAPNLRRLKKSNTFSLKPVNVLKSALVLGPNGSGKTNLFSALRMMRGLIKRDADHTSYMLKGLPYQPFKMDPQCIKEPTKFSVTLLISKKIYNYEFYYDKKRIVYESLKELKPEEDLVIFTREFFYENEDYFYFLPDSTPDIRDVTREDMLYLTLLANRNHTTATKILKWFANDLIFIGSDVGDITQYEDIVEELENDRIKRSVVDLLRIADFNLIDIEIRSKIQKLPDKVFEALKLLKSDDSDDSNDELNERVVKDIYTIYKRTDNERVPIHLDSFESRGTKKMLLLATILINAIKEEGKTILIDEFDNAFHLAISLFILKIVNSSDLNLYTQFILNTHNLDLMKNNLLRVDQIWFAEKDKSNQTEFYSLYDFNLTNRRARHDVSYASDYLSGKYGAWPIVNVDAMRSILEEVRK